MLPDNLNIFLLRLLVSPALFGSLFLIIGLLASKYPPKSVNMFYGYRTRRSMLSQDAWTTANRYAPILMIRLGGACLLLGILSALLISNLKILTFLTAGVTILVVVLMLLLTEKKLNTLFDEAGNKRKAG